MRSEEDVRVIGPKDKRDRHAINCCSISQGWSQGLSPFILGPVELWDGRVSRTMENAWQYSKVYKHHLSRSGLGPNAAWISWSQKGFDNPRAVRYPMGRGREPVGCWINGELWGYIGSRRQLYWPLYRDAVRNTEAFQTLNALFVANGKITLWDFDGYDRGNKSLLEVLECPTRKMGHAFVLAAMLVYGPDIEPGDLPLY